MKHALRVAIASAGLALSLADMAALADGVGASDVGSLCAAAEDTLFSCKVARERVVSVCASKALSPTTGYLQYRFGPRGKPELVVPKDLSDASAWREHVQSRSLMYSGGGGAYLRFDHAPYAYVTYSAIGRGWGEKKGVMVIKDNTVVANHKCVGPLRSHLGTKLFRSAGIGEDAVELDLP